MYTLSHGVALTALGHANDDKAASLGNSIEKRFDDSFFFVSCKNELNYFSCVTGRLMSTRVKKTFFIIITTFFVSTEQIPHSQWTEGCNNRCLINYLN